MKERKFSKKENLIRNKRLTLILMICILMLGVLVCFAKFENISNSTIGMKIKNFFNGSSDEELPRKKLNFNYGWTFSKGEGYNNKNSTLPEEKVITIPNNSDILPYDSNYVIQDNVGLNSEIWSNVSLPHTYNDTDTFNNFNELAGNGQNGERSMYTGTAWYKKNFIIPEEYRGKKVYIEFEAARQAAKVYLNGNLLEGTSENGFMPFGYDLTPYINYGTDNQITVMVDNSLEYKIEGTNSIIPWNDSHWHPTLGGLYRNSYLYIVDELHLTLPLNSFLETEGTYIYTSDETATTAKIHVNAQIENSSNSQRTFSYIAEVKDSSGNVVLTMRSDSQVLQSGEKKIFILANVLENVKRWSDDYPYLYTIVCKIEENGIIVDNNENEFGIRTVRYTTDGGMYLNENYTILNGWGQKSTNEWAGLGSAYPDWMQDYVIRLMKKAGSNYTRYGHTAGGPEQIEASNRFGIMVLQPGVDSEGNYGGTYTNDSYSLRESAFKDMIIYYRNNPSIIMWELGNQSNISETCMQNLYNIVNQYDYGNRGESEPSNIESATSVANSSELVSAINLKNVGSYDSTTTQSDRLIALRQGSATSKKYVELEESTEGEAINMGDMPVIEGEYNRLEARRGVWDFYTKGYSDFKNVTNSSGYADVTSEEFALSQVQKYTSIISKTQMNGTANWIFSDTISHGRLGSEVSRASGEVDAVMLEKEAYWVCKTIFSKNAGIHIIGHWNYELGTTKNIYVVAKKAVSVELKINGVSKEINTNPTNSYLYSFNNIAYEPGNVEVIARDINGNIVATDTMQTDGTPEKLKITPITSEQGLLANGSDVLLLDVEVIDSNGNRCESFDGIRDNILTTFTINDENGCSVWRGGYNSSLENSTNNKYLYIESGIARVAVRTTMKSGAITVTAETPGLESDTVTVNSINVDNTNGYCKTLNSKLSYSLDTLDYVEYGDGLKRGTNLEELKSNESNLIENLSYTGETAISIAKPMGIDKKVYNDLDDNFDSVPFELKNAEYIMLNNENNGDTATDLINFKAKTDIYVYILRDENVKEPEWIKVFKQDKDIVTTNSEMIYHIMKKEYKAGETIVLGGNSDNGIDGKKGRMYVVAIKSKLQVDNGIFYYEDFEGLNNWNFEIKTDTTIEKETEDGINHFLTFTDTTTTDLAYMYSEYAKLTDRFKFSYRLKIDSSVATNKWIRTWIAQGTIENPKTETKNNVLTEIYFSREENNIVYREKSSSISKTLGKIPSYDEWHTYEYSLDTKANKFLSYADGNLINDSAYFWKDLDYSDKVIIGTGNNSLNIFSIDDVSITPIPRTTIDGIIINEVELENFNPLTQSYNTFGNSILNLNSIEVIEGETFSSKSIEFTDNYIKLNVTDTSGDTQTYKIYIEQSTVNKTELRCLISKIDGLDINHYEEQAIQEIEALKQQAKELEINETATNLEVTNLIDSINLKLRELIYK